ncbi:MAG: recombinase family protein [Oscillospiraceae bacterium]|nr:recombinase family protein [Oscillospiraceae bacterium]
MNFLTKERIKNTGQAPQFYIESSHPGIIEPEVFDMVQSEIALRKRAGKQTKTPRGCRGSSSARAVVHLSDPNYGTALQRTNA